MMSDGSPERRASRLGDLGARVATVAHELKVPLSLIIGSLESLDVYVASLIDRVAELEAHATGPGLASSDPSQTRVAADAAALVRICREGAERLERVVQEIAVYARGSAPARTRTRIDVARVLRTTVDLVARSTANAPPVRLELGDMPDVYGDESALARAVVNLLRNAFDALTDVADPLVRVGATTSADAGETWIDIRIEDNGAGIPDVDRAHLFEPFFTGKAYGAGLGLGLAIAKELIEAQQGTITLAPTAPGTAFVIRLPVAQ